MSLIKRPNSNNRYYLFQIQGRKYFGSTLTPKKTLAVKIEAKVREDAISRLVLGEVKPITLGPSSYLKKDSNVALPQPSLDLGVSNLMWSPSVRGSQLFVLPTLRLTW